ncbi:MAG: FHA domain-containing protein [Actinomycetota bacterium]
MYCTRCGHRNPPDSKFCSKCGHPLHDDTTIGLEPTQIEDDTGEIIDLPLEDLREGQALLVVTRGPNAGSQFLIEKEVTTLGRHPESDIFLDDITVSRRHAEIRRKDGSFFVHDMGSLNGTYVGRNRVDNTQLANGDELQVGKFKLIFFAGQGE